MQSHTHMCIITYTNVYSCSLMCMNEHQRTYCYYNVYSSVPMHNFYTLMYTFMFSVFRYMHAYKHASIYACIHTHLHTYTPTHLHIHTHLNTHTPTHILTHTHQHNHTYTCVPSPPGPRSQVCLLPRSDGIRASVSGSKEVEQGRDTHHMRHSGVRYGDKQTGREICDTPLHAQIHRRLSSRIGASWEGQPACHLSPTLHLRRLCEEIHPSHTLKVPHCAKT